MRIRTSPKIGERFGRLTVIGESTRAHNRTAVPCRCECGTEKTVLLNNLRAGRTASCGCLHKEGFVKMLTKHGGRVGAKSTPLYTLWREMIGRCTYPSHASWIWYGKRGITVCPEWMTDFLAFKAWCESNGHTKGLELDRIDNDGPYAPGNCRFVTPKENSRNRSNTVMVTAFGETKALSAWAEDERCQVGYSALYQRIRRQHWNPEDAIMVVGQRSLPHKQ